MTALVFADYVCPFCFLEIPVLERLAREDGVKIDYKAFELRPEPVPTLDPRGTYLTRTWARSVYPLAEQLGIVIRLPPVQPRSRLAFEGLCFAKARGQAHAYNKAVYEAFFQAGRDIGDLAILVEIAASVGLPCEEFKHALADHTHRSQVLADEREAEDLGIDAVPAVLLNRHLLSGCVPYEDLRLALD